MASEPGQGTRFKLFFPISGNAPLVRTQEEDDVKTEHIDGTILLVDDEETVLAVARIMLEQAGFVVLTAGDGRKALDVLRGHLEEISAVLLDLTMPHMDGIETFKEIHRLRPDLPVILSSGYNEQVATGQLAHKGRAGFIQKPYEAKALIEKLRKVLKRRPE